MLRIVSPLHSIINGEQHEISTINPAIPENTECLIFKAHAFIDLKMGVSLDYSVSLCSVLLLAFGQRSKQRAT